MGQLKALLPFGCRTVIEQVLQPLLSAELAQVVSDIETQWAAILRIHAQQFTREVQQTLVAAYGEVYSLIFAD